MNYSLSHLTIQHQFGSNFLHLSPRSKKLRFSLDKSHFSYFTSSFLFSTSKSLGFSADRTIFDHFQSTAIVLSKANIVPEGYTITQKLDELQTNFTRCSFQNCYSKELDGGAIRGSDQDYELQLNLCNFYECVTINGKAGAVFLKRFNLFNVTKSCFSHCYATDQSAVIHAISEKKPLLISDTIFSECGQRTTKYLNYYERTDLTYSTSNTSFCVATLGAFYHVEKPRAISLKNNFWAYCEGTNLFSHPQSVDASKSETWEFNNIFYNSVVDVLVNGSIDATINFLAMAGNSFGLFWNADESSTIFLTNAIFDFSPAKLVNKEHNTAKIEYRHDVKFDALDVTPIQVKVAAHDYCYAFKVKRPFTKAFNPVVRIQQMGISNHPHIVILICLMFIAIILVVFYLLQRKSEARLGMMRAL